MKIRGRAFKSAVALLLALIMMVGTVLPVTAEGAVENRTKIEDREMPKTPTTNTGIGCFSKYFILSLPVSVLSIIP